MPVYEFYCPDCHAIHHFFSRGVDTQTRPACPGCGRLELERQASLFAIGSRRAEDSDKAEPGLDGLDETKLMTILGAMGKDLDRLDDDPRQAAQAMRALFATAGLKPGEGMAEALHRLESGEDPDRIEAELGDAMEQENPFASEALRRLRRELLPPSREDIWNPLRPTNTADDPEH